MTMTSAAKFEEKLTLDEFYCKQRQAWKFVLWCSTFGQKYIIFEPKKYRGAIWHSTEERRTIWREQTCALKNDIRNLTNFDPALESLKVYTLMESFWPKYKMFELKKCRGVMYHYTEDRYKHIRKNNLWFHKWHEEFGELHHRTQKIDLKICTSREFLFKVYNFALKSYIEVVCHDSEGWYKVSTKTGRKCYLS